LALWARHRAAISQGIPENYEEYRRSAKKGKLHPGKILVHNLHPADEPTATSLNFPTKRHWKGKSRIEDIEAA